MQWKEKQLKWEKSQLQETVQKRTSWTKDWKSIRKPILNIITLVFSRYNSFGNVNIRHVFNALQKSLNESVKITSFWWDSRQYLIRRCRSQIPREAEEVSFILFASTYFSGFVTHPMEYHIIFKQKIKVKKCCFRI